MPVKTPGKAGRKAPLDEGKQEGIYNSLKGLTKGTPEYRRTRLKLAFLHDRTERNIEQIFERYAAAHPEKKRDDLESAETSP